MSMTDFFILYESEAGCLARLAAQGITGEPAREIAAYLAQATDLAAFFERIQNAFAPHGIVVYFFELGDHAAYLPLLRQNPTSCLLWNVTDGFYFYRGSFAASTAALLGAPTFGSPPQAQHLCQDKFKCVTLATALGIPIPPTALWRDGAPLSPTDHLVGDPAQPLFVKPNRLGAKLGIWPDSKCATFEQAAALSRRIFTRYGDDAAVQRYIPGYDVRVSFMNAAGPAQKSRPGIYRLVDLEGSETGGDFMTMQDNWTLSAARSEQEAGLDSPFAGRTAAFRPRLLDLHLSPAAAGLVSRIESAVDAAVTLFGLRDLYSFDFRVTPDGTPYFLEFEVCPAVTIYDFQTYLEEMFGVDLPQALVRSILNCQQIVKQ